MSFKRVKQFVVFLDFDNEYKMNIIANTSFIDEQKVSLKTLHIIDEEEEPKAKIKSLTVIIEMSRLLSE